MLKQKIVLEIGKMYCKKCQKKCRKIAAVADGFISMAIEAEKSYLVITGVGIDTASLVKSLRKEVGSTVIVSIEVLKTPVQKEDEIKKQAKELLEEEAEKKKKKKTLTWSYNSGHCDNNYYNYSYPPPPLPPGYEMVCYCAASYPNTWFTW